jgi:glycosyltransferase involved in cell wall biosynthesis
LVVGWLFAFCTLNLKISIIVPAFNEEKLLSGSLASIRLAMQAIDEAGWSSELIVCDNNSTDRTAQIAADAGALVVFEPVNQISRARNAGAARATGEWLIFVDADSYPSRALFVEVVEQIRGGRCLAGGATVTVHATGPEPSLPMRMGIRLIVGGWNILSRVAHWGAGSFIFCDAATFRDIGGFSQTLYAAEEIDLFRRLKRVARRTRRRIVILRRHPLLTSGRKADLYTPREALAFYLRLFVTGGRALRSAQGAFVWYDGRR